MAKLYSWEFRTSPSCYGHQNMFGSKNMFSKILLLLMTFIHILSKSISFSVNNAEYPVVMPSSSVNHYKRTGVQERECFSGRLCEYRISESDFLCKVQTYVISKKAERFLPKWLWFNEEKRTLFGIPSEKDRGICDILIIGLTKLPNHPTGHICGSVTIKITVWGLNSFPLFAQNSLLRVKIRGNSDGQINTCAFNEPIILASLVLSSNILDLNGEKRWEFIEALSSSYNISIQNTFVLPNTVQNPFLNLLESSHVVASGPGANRFASGSSILLTWHVKCGVIQLDDPLFEQLKQLSQKWSRTKNISYGVIGWYVITGFQNHYVKHAVLRRRRNVIGGSTTLVHSTIPISRATIVTTKLKPNKTTYRSQTATLTRSLPSPTFSSPVGSSSLFDVFSSSSTVQLDQINSSSSQYSIRNSSSEVLRSRNLSMISQFSSSAKLRTSIQPSSTSTQVMQRSTTYILLPSSIHLISPSGYGTASNELLSSTEFTAKISTISSFLISRDTNNATSFRMRSSSNISPLIVNSSFLKTTPYPFLISSNSTFKILDTAIVSTLALIRSTELLSFAKKYLSSLKSNFVRSRTYFTASQDYVLRTTSAISGIAVDTTTVVKTINQSRSESSSSTARPTQSPSIVSTHVLLSSTQSYDRTASNPIYTVDFSSTRMLHTDISSTTPMVNKTSQVVRSLSFRSSVIHQTKTVVSFQPYSSTPGVNITSKASRTILTSTINKQRETATRQLVTYSSKLNLYPSTDDTAIKKGSTVTSTQSMSTGFSLQTSVKDETTFSKTLIQTSRKTSQFQTTVLTSSKYMVSDFIKTTTATRFKPVQSSATSVTLTKEISSLLTSMKDKTTFSKTLIQTSSKTSQFKISGTTTATSFKPVQLSSTSVIRSKGISSSVSRAITSDTMSTTNFTETTFMSSMPTSVVKLTSLGLTTLFVSSKIEPSTIELSAATAERSRSSLNSTTLRILPTSSTPLLSPSLLTNYFNTAILTLPTEQLTSTPSFSYFIKEPSSTPLVTPTSVQTNTDISLRSSSASPSSSSIVPFPTTPPKNSPKLYNSFDLLAVTVGKVFNVQIPIDTFHDREDGNTRNLFLSCLDGNHGSLSRSSWLQFNTTTQTLYGVVLASQVQQIKTSSEYLLVAKDRDGNKAYDAFTIDVRNKEETLAVSFSVRIMGTNVEMFNQDLSNMLLLVQKIADYYGDKDESLIRVMSVEDGSVVVTWGNATVQTCNEDLINELTSRIVTTEGNIQPDFYNTLLPTFLAADVYRNRTGPCISPVTTEDPGVARISSHDDSTWLKYFLPGLVVALLIIIVAVTCFIVRRHSGVKILKADKRTFKRRKPIILDDELEMSTLSGKPIELPDDSLTPIRYPKETALTNPVYDGSDGEDFPEWSSPILPAPSYQRLPPRYGSSGDSWGYNTPPPPYKLPPSY